MPFIIHSNELDYVPKIKLLGAIIDNSLSFKAHIKEICRKVNTKVSILHRICKIIPSDIMIKLCKEFILPHFEYASSLFIGLSKGLLLGLFLTTLNRLLMESYLRLPIKSLEHRRIEQALILVYNSIYNQAPNYIREMF